MSQSASKIDSNITGLRFAEESSLKVLPSTPIWRPLEPNGYNDFGGNLKTVARNPINPSRQRIKGVTTDLDATGGFGTDVVQNGLTRLLQGFFFAAIREKATSNPLNGTQNDIASVTASSSTYTGTTTLAAFLAGDLVKASGFSYSANNGLKVVSSVSTTALVVTGTVVDETPTTDAILERVGHQFASGDATITIVSGLPQLNTTTFDLTTLGLIAGEWVFLGGDSASTRFSTEADRGFCRVKSVAAHKIVFDKTSTTFVADTGSSITLQMFFGNVIKNEAVSSLIKTYSYQLERTLGSDDDGVMSEYLVGAIPNELSLSVKQADKLTMDLSFVALDHEQRTGSTGVKSGTRPDMVEEDAFNTSSDFSRIKMHLIESGDANPDPLFAYITELTLSIKNNVSACKAVGVLGAFDAAVGTFEVGASMTAYFADVTAVSAVRNNSDVTLDMAIVKANHGMVWDLPLVSLGDGRLKVEADKSITLPLSADAAVGSNNHTLLLNLFPYLPTIAE